jgi:hypothetical protein
LLDTFLQRRVDKYLLHTRTYTRMHACMSACKQTHAYMCTYVLVCMHAPSWTCTHVHGHACIHMQIYTYIHFLNTCAFWDVYVYTHVRPCSTYKNMHAYIVFMAAREHVKTKISARKKETKYAHMHSNMYVCTHIHVYIHIN